MVKIKTSYPHCMILRDTFHHGIEGGGVTIEKQTQARKLMGKLLARLAETQDSINASLLAIQTARTEAGDDKKKLEAVDERLKQHTTEVEAVNKEIIEVETTKEHVNALKEILEKIDWSKAKRVLRTQTGQATEPYYAMEQVKIDQLIESLGDAQEVKEGK